MNEMKIGDQIRYISGFNVYENPGSAEVIAAGFAQETTYIVSDGSVSKIG